MAIVLPPQNLVTKVGWTSAIEEKPELGRRAFSSDASSVCFGQVSALPELWFPYLWNGGDHANPTRRVRLDTVVSVSDQQLVEL